MHVVGKSLADVEPSLCGPDEAAVPANPISLAGPSTGHAIEKICGLTQGRGHGQPRGHRQGAVERGGFQATTQLSPIGGLQQPNAASSNQVKRRRVEKDVPIEHVSCLLIFTIFYIL